MNVSYSTSALVSSYRHLLKQVSIQYGVWDEQQSIILPEWKRFSLKRALQRVFPKKQKPQQDNKQSVQQPLSKTTSYADPYLPNPTTSALTFTIFGSISKFITDVLSQKTLIGGEKFVKDAILRAKGVPLITVANHVSAVDEPAVLTASVPIWVLMNYDLIRWVLCATDRCFKYAALIPFFKQVKTLPIERGKGIEQPGFQAAQELLNRGEWIHMFPEGTRTKDGKIQSLKKGVGKLVLGCYKTPMIVPIIHTGMENVFPKGSKIPVPFQKVKIIVGDAIDISDIMQMSNATDWDDEQLSMIISKRIELHMKVIHAQLHKNTEDEAMYQEQLKQHKLSFSGMGEPGWQYSVFSQQQNINLQKPWLGLQGIYFSKAYDLMQWWKEYQSQRQSQLYSIVGA